MINLLCSIGWEIFGISASAVIGISGLILSIVSINSSIKEGRRDRMHKDLILLEGNFNAYFSLISISKISLGFTKLEDIFGQNETNFVYKTCRDLIDENIALRDNMWEKHYNFMQLLEALNNGSKLGNTNYKKLFDIINGCYIKTLDFLNNYHIFIRKVQEQIFDSIEIENSIFEKLKISLKDIYKATGLMIELKYIIITLLRNIYNFDNKVRKHIENKEELLEKVFHELKKKGVIIDIKNDSEISIDFKTGNFESSKIDIMVNNLIESTKKLIKRRK